MYACSSCHTLLSNLAFGCQKKNEAQQAEQVMNGWIFLTDDQAVSGKSSKWIIFFFPYWFPSPHQIRSPYWRGHSDVQQIKDFGWAVLCVCLHLFTWLGEMLSCHYKSIGLLRPLICARSIDGRRKRSWPCVHSKITPNFACNARALPARGKRLGWDGLPN